MRWFVWSLFCSPVLFELPQSFTEKLNSWCFLLSWLRFTRNQQSSVHSKTTWFLEDPTTRLNHDTHCVQSLHILTFDGSLLCTTILLINISSSPLWVFSETTIDIIYHFVHHLHHHPVTHKLDRKLQTLVESKCKIKDPINWYLPVDTLRHRHFVFLLGIHVWSNLTDKNYYD